MGDADMIGKIRVQMTVYVHVDDEDVVAGGEERRVFRVFSPESFLVPPVAGAMIWAAQGLLAASIDKVVIDPGEPLAAIVCEGKKPIDEEMFKKLLDDGWIRMRSRSSVSPPSQLKRTYHHE